MTIFNIKQHFKTPKRLHNNVFSMIINHNMRKSSVCSFFRLVFQCWMANIYSAKASYSCSRVCLAILC